MTEIGPIPILNAFYSCCPSCNYIMLGDSGRWGEQCPRCQAGSMQLIPPQFEPEIEGFFRRPSTPIDIPRPPTRSREPEYAPTSYHSLLPDWEGRRDTEYEQTLLRSFEDAGSPPPKPADPRLLAEMNKFKLAQRNKTPIECPICLEHIVLMDDVVQTTCCGNMCHYKCMEKTLRVLPSCPFCRFQPGVCCSAPK
jgi:hypothetical protein